MVTVVFGFLIASFITKSTRSVLIGLLLWFVGYFLTFVADLESGNSTIVSVLSLFPVTAFSYGLQEIGRLEDAGQGVTTQTFNTTDSPSGYTFATCIYMLIIDSILWSVVAWYFNRVIPTEYGTPLKFYFPFTVSYWCPGTARAPPLTGEETERADEGTMLIEPVSNALKQQADEGRSIEIHGLSKVFGDKQAVDGLSLSMYNGQVTALLGHNGAGKVCVSCR
jgi:ABC-type multidrug transport system fused ATPase/permease subunit